MLKLNKEDLASVESDLGQVLLKGIIKNQVIMNWLNKQCEVNVDGYFLPIFQHFIYDVVPQLIHYCYSFNSIYKDISIDCVLTTHKWLLPEFAAMAVASQDSKIKCVQISHGFSIFDNNTWKYSEQPCDTYITSDEEISNYFKKHLKLDIDKKTPAIKISQSWLNNNSYENVNRSRQIKNITYSKKEIIFVPTMFTGHHLRFDGSFYLPTWYYKLQLYFIELFSQLKDFDFIYKGIKGNDVYYNPIELIIKDRFYDNVKFSNNRLLEEYKNADGVIMDYPSTPFIESLAMGIPSIAIYHRSLKIRQTAENKYKGIIYSFNKISECKKPIINFLNSIPNWPVYYYDNTQLNSIYHTL